MSYPPAPKPTTATEHPSTLPSSASFESLNRSLSRAKEHVETSEKSLESLHRKVRQTSSEITNLQDQIARLSSQLAAKFREREEYKDLIPHAEGEVGRAKERLLRLQECLARVEKDMRVEAWMEEMEREEEREQEGFKRYLREVGRSAPDSIANVRVRSASPNRDTAEAIPTAFDGEQLREALSERLPSPPIPPTQITSLIDGGDEPDPDAPSLRPRSRNARPHHRPRHDSSSPPHQFIRATARRRTPSPSYANPIVIHSSPDQFQPTFSVPVPIGSPVPIPISSPPLLLEPHPSQFMGPFFTHGPSPVPVPVGMIEHMHQPYASSHSFSGNRHDSPRGSPDMRRHRVLTPPIPVHHGSPPSPLRFTHTPVHL